MRLEFTLLVTACVVNAYGPIKGGKTHRTTTQFPPEQNPLPGDSANSIIGEPQPPSSSTSSSSGSYWWQGNNAFTGAGGSVQPQQPQQSLQPQQPLQPQHPLQPQKPQQPQQPFQPQQPLQPQGNPFLSGLKQPCTASNHFCVPKQQCHDGLIVVQKKPQQATEGQCEAATQICCKLALSSQPGVVTGTFDQPEVVVTQPGISHEQQSITLGGPGHAGFAPGQNIVGHPNQQGPAYFSVGQPQQPGFVPASPAQPSQLGSVSGPTGQPQQPGVISGSTGLVEEPGFEHGPSRQPQQPGIISGSAGQVQTYGLVYSTSGQPQQSGVISGPSSHAQQPGIVTGPYGQPQQIGVISGTTDNAEQPGIIFAPSGHAQQPGSVFQSNTQQQPGSPQFVGGSSNTKQYYKPSPGTNGAPIGGSIFDVPSVTPNPSHKQYTYPLNTTPYPGCAAALKCVKESFCTADGVMSNVQVILTREQIENKVPLTECVDPESGIEGKCCRDPNYKDPWPAGMMMPAGHNAGNQLLDECSPDGICLHSYQCGEQNKLRPLKSCRVPLDGASGVCCSSDQTGFNTGQKTLSTGALSNTQTITGPTQSQKPLSPGQLLSGQPSASLANNPFISQAGVNPASGTRQPSFQTQQPQLQYNLQTKYTPQTQFTPQTPGQYSPFLQTGSQGQQPVLQHGSKLESPQQNIPDAKTSSQLGLQTGSQGQQPVPQTDSRLESPKQNIPGAQTSSQPGFQNEPNGNGQAILPGFQQQSNNGLPAQSEETILPGAPIPPQILQEPINTSQPQPNVPAATGQGAADIQPTRTSYPSVPQPTIIGQPIPAESCGVHRTVSREGLSKTDSGFGEFPWQVLIVDNNNQSAVCSGAIIARKAVVTTAHCVEKLASSDILVKAGVWRLSEINQLKPVQISSAAAKSIHPKFEGNSLFNDMAILILNEPFVPDQHVDFICLPEVTPAGPQNSCVATGWGKPALQGNSRDDILHQVPVQFITEADCQSSFRSTFLGSYFQLHKSFQCAVPMFQDTDLCKVGAGGPVACEPGDGRYVLSGLYSWDLGCGSTVTPTALSRLDAAWLRAILNTPVEVLLAEDERRQELARLQQEVIDSDSKPGFSQGYGRK